MRFPRHPIFQKIFDPASPGVGVAPAQYLNGLRTLSEGHSFFRFFRFGSLRDRFIAFRSRSLAQRFVRGHALRFDEFAAEGQTRPDIRARMRCIATRTRARHAATRTRAAVAAIDHTAY